MRKRIFFAKEILYHRRNQGFTLVELLIVIAIFALMLSMSAPAISDFRKQRELRSAGQFVQTTFLQSRSLGISSSGQIYVIFFVADNDAVTLPPSGGSDSVTVQGAKGSIYTYEFRTDDAGDKALFQIGQPLVLPPLVSFETPAATKTYTFNRNGTISFAGNLGNDPDSQDNTDVVIRQTGTNLKCYLDINPNTGKVRFAVR